mgnify:CR=1 FL=1
MSEAKSVNSRDGGKFIPLKKWTEVFPRVYDVDGDVIATDIPSLINTSGAIRVKFRHVSGNFSVTESNLN